MKNRYQLVFSKRADKSIEGHFDFYNDISNTLAAKFLKDLYERITSLRSFPIRTILKDSYMYIPLKKFPIIIVYEILNSQIVVVDIIHSSTYNKYLN